MTNSNLVRDFAHLRLSDAEDAGGKGANLGEMIAAGLPVPPGFVLLRDCYRNSMRAGGVTDELNAAHRAAMAQVGNPDRLIEMCEQMQTLVWKGGIADEVRDQVLRAYRALGDNVSVAVRSSATGEDGKDASFAGMNATFTNISGEDDLIEAVQRCWASLFSPRVVTYRASRNFGSDPAMAVVVQQMIASERSGVAFTADPSTGAEDRVVVEAAFGQGEVVVSGSVEPDTYIVSKEHRKILSTRLGYKSFKIVRGADGSDATIDLGEEEATAKVLSDAELLEIVDLALAIEKHHGCAQDTEWAIAGGKTWFVQARPVTTLHHATMPAPETHDVVARGLPAAPGEAAGTVRVLLTPEEGSRLRDGEVLVSQMTNPDWLPTMRRAAALVTDTGGMTCHAAIVARELGVPCIVGARTATTDLKDGMLVTVDGTHGRVLTGDAVAPRRPRRWTVPPARRPPSRPPR
ncbi:hypothetical protein MDUV_23080 [Mycolicibacterium duvalii]|uniref:Phosphoenolpyruvate synthase n=1 Tax=Mycolicibacterium duvalii TaxID=39688 RepID=A0A7I7K1K7_9MYCO|nr:hypothetical protein MDUV_23080 [Mycolicibacterium duvalii]